MAVARWLKAFAIAYVLEGLGLAIYYAYSRPYIVERLGKEYSLAVMLAAAELIPSIFSVFTGFLGDRIGRRRMILVGVLRLPALSAIAYLEPQYIPVAVGILYLATSISYPSSLGTILEAGGRTGRAYAWITLFSGIGWCIGGVVPGLIEPVLGSSPIFILSGTLLALSSIIQFTLYPRAGASSSISWRSVVRGLKRARSVSLAILMASAALSMYYSIILMKIYAEVESLMLYGLFTTTLAALTGTILRPLAGRLVDKQGPDIVLVIALASYATLNIALYVARGPILLVLWLVPIFPFRDTAQTIAISKRLPPELQATAAGILATLNSIAGVIVLATTPAIKSYGILGGLIISEILIIISIAILLTAINITVRHKKDENPTNMLAFVATHPRCPSMDIG